ncbi:MAG TPA: aminotransferase class I/II-fold pyridoxal phosphate-dependent enzyme [Myxococcales bacterium]|nr:aminotransferase class I/II-fold pyridoxal phosphate-dependent enzyme [Myxococcales bacterium]
MNPLLGRLAGYLQEKANAQREEALRSGKPVYDFGIGDPREPTPEFIRKALRDALPEVSQYPSIAGIPPLRKAVSAYLKRRFALSLDPDSEILPCAGAKEALFHLPLCAASPDRPLCWYPDPAYPVYERAILFAGATPRTYPLRAERSFLPDLDAISADDWRRTSLWFDCYPHNPTGAGAPRAYHEKLARLAKEHGFLVVCDEPYIDLYVREPPHSGLQVSRQNLIVIHSLSKRSGMTGYRSGFIAGDREVIRWLRDARANFGVASQAFVQQAAIVAWSDDAHVEERRRIFAEKRAVLLAHLRKLGLEVGGEGAFYLWVRVPPGETSEGYAARLAARNILVVDGTQFGREGKGFIRLAMVPTVADCRAAIEAWPA